MELQLRDVRKEFAPGDELSGTASWRFDKAPKSVEVRLMWFTRGKGTMDVVTVEATSPAAVDGTGSFAFSFRLPDAPYSFSGKLISLVWAVELVAPPEREAKRVEFTLAPAGKEILLVPLKK